MLFRRIHDDTLAQSAYLIGCQATHEAIVIDPVLDSSRYLDAASEEGVRITLVTETHVHADFLSGAGLLAQAAGAELALSGEGSGPAIYRRGAYPTARWLHEGDSIRVGQVRLDVMHVPGHTPEHIAFLVTDEARSTEPVGLVSGDFLFVGDVGRPDLLERAVGVSGTMEQSARDLYRSLQRVRALPGHLQLWPGHGAGSACGKALGAVPQSTLGYETRAGWAFASAGETAFVDEVLAGQPEPPAYFARMKHLNAHGGAAPAAPAGGDGPVPTPVAGPQMVDARTPSQFAAGHLAGAINIPLGTSFLGWAGSVLDAARDVILLAAPDRQAEAERAARSLRLIGVDRVGGVLAPAELSAMTTSPLATIRTVPASVLGKEAHSDVTVLDVRNRSEWDAGHVPGARHIPLTQLTARLNELRDAGPILVHCQGGSRSAVAASVLQAAGFADVANVEGGFAAWVRAGHRPATDG